MLHNLVVPTKYTVVVLEKPFVAARGYAAVLNTTLVSYIVPRLPNSLKCELFAGSCTPITQPLETWKVSRLGQSYWIREKLHSLSLQICNVGDRIFWLLKRGVGADGLFR